MQQPALVYEDVLASEDPENYKTHPNTKLLASVYRAIIELVPANPDAPAFRLGKTLGDGNTNWRRVKKGMPDRYRLFFRCKRAINHVLEQVVVI